ncbi:MAG: RNA polymerase factor sigma-54 [Rhodobacteraceae bacterium]|nr:RNA polymerase factor sigma-54 [Paracoccaceae bacterium]
MLISQTLNQRQTLVMTTRMQAAVRILGMSNQALGEHLESAARDNPYLDLRLPSSFRGGQSDFDAVAALAEAPAGLQAHVARQIELTFRNARDRAVAAAFAEALEPTGWLNASVAEVARAAGCSLETAEDVLADCQEFEPAGLFARSLAECLRLQARDQGCLDAAMRVVLDNLPLVAAGRLDDLAEAAGLDEAAIAATIRQLRSFDPKPGLAFGDAPAPIQPPDLIVRRDRSGWEVELNRSELPAVRVSEGLNPDAISDPAARSYAREALSAARWLERTVARRHGTLLKVAVAIVRRQGAFLDHGPGHLEPLALADIAEELDLHASTISRAIAWRRIETPRGTLALKAFFSRPVGDSEDAKSRDAVLAMVRRIVAAENPARPLSDEAILRKANAEGAGISRRTVAKYRDVLGIPSSFARKRKTAGPAARAG